MVLLSSSKHLGLSAFNIFLKIRTYLITNSNKGVCEAGPAKQGLVKTNTHIHKEVYGEKITLEKSLQLKKNTMKYSQYLPDPGKARCCSTNSVILFNKLDKVGPVNNGPSTD